MTKRKFQVLLFLALSLTVLLFFPNRVSGGVNVVENPGFDDHPHLTSWTNESTWSNVIRTDEWHGGGHCLAETLSGGQYKPLKTTQKVDVDSDIVLSVSCWYKYGDEHGLVDFFQINYTDGTQQNVSLSYVTYWLQVNITVTSGKTLDSVILLRTSDDPTILMIDDVYIYVEAAPTTGEFQAPTTAYANKYFFLNYTVSDEEGNTTLKNSTLTIVNGSATFFWLNSTNAFSETSDPSDYWTLDTVNSLRVSVNSTSYRLCFKLKANWNFIEGLIDVNASVFDDHDDEATASQTDLFTFEDDLIVQAATMSQYANPSSSITAEGLLYYQGTTTLPEDLSGITGYVSVGDTVKGYDSSINSTGYFTVTFDSEPTRGNSSYKVYALTDEATVQNQTVWNLVDQVAISMSVSDNRINVNTNASIGVSGIYAWDGMPFDGTFILNYTTYTHSVPSRHDYTVASISGGSRAPITSISTNDEGYVIWDYVITNITVADNNVDVNTNASISVSSLYAYDMAAFDGSFTLNYTTYNHSTPQRQGYTVSSVAGGSYGITAIGVNDEDYVIWNRAKIESGGLTSAYLHCGDVNKVYFVVKYECEDALITDGGVWVNGSAMTYNATAGRWEYTFTKSVQGNYTYIITAVSGNSEGITVVNDLAGLQNFTFYANMCLQARDTEEDPILSDVKIYMYNGSNIFSGGTPGPGESYGRAFVGMSGNLFSQTVNDSWVNMTGITTATVELNATWYDLTVNATWNLTMYGDTMANVSCLCYPFQPSGVTYYAASNATISSCTFASYALTTQFSGAAGSYVLCVTGPRPTYLLNVTYDLTSDYTTYLWLPHYGNQTLLLNYQNWAGTYIQKIDKLMSGLAVDGQKVTMTFTGNVSAVGEVDVYCGMRGNPPETGGFTMSSYVSGVFIGYYTFTATQKTVYLQWSPSGPGPIGPIQYPEYPNVYIEIAFSFPKSVQPGQKVTGNLTVTWSGVNTIKLETLKCEAPYENWTIQVSTLPITLSLNASVTKGFVQIPVTLTIPAKVATGTYNVPCVTSFTAAPNLVRGFRSALSFQVAIPSAPIPSLLIFACLGSIAVFIPMTALFTSRRRKHRLKPY